jgi:hypothetical protein
MPDRWAEMKRLADLATAILYEEGKVIHAMAYPAGTWRRKTPLMHEIRREGRDL